jgi:hypothetical protein
VTRPKVGAVACAPVLSVDGTVVSRMPPPMTCNRTRLMSRILITFGWA